MFLLSSHWAGKTQILVLSTMLKYNTSSSIQSRCSPPYSHEQFEESEELVLGALLTQVLSKTTYSSTSQGGEP